jgi:hypothetical protein
VYRAKLRDLKDLLIKKKYFGEVATYVYVTKLQKRGCHMSISCHHEVRE